MRISDWSSDVCSSDLAIRRFWRFGQSKPVNCHIIAAETEGANVSNIRRKVADADRMAAAMVKHMADLSSAAIKGSARDTPKYNPSLPVILPKFRSEEHTSELQSLLRISYAVFCLPNNKPYQQNTTQP